MNIDWKSIKEKYPLAYERYEYWIVEESTCLNEYESCYCDIESFFDQNGIEIFIEQYIDDDDHKFYHFQILFNNVLQFSWANKQYFRTNSREEAKEAAIYKAFEILNEKLK